MAEFERDPEIGRRYRELGAEEPPRALDEAILAASRRRAPQRWAGPVALAAMLVLAVAVTVHVEREKPQDEVIVAKAPPAPKAVPAPVEEPAKRPEVLAEKRAAPAAKKAELRVFTPDPPPQQPAAAAPAAAAADSAASRRDAQEVVRNLGRSVSPSVMARLEAGESPEAWLNRIADLRRQEKHEEADKALAEFRKRHPDYRLNDEMRARVERK
jgi:hypothetical protein